MADAGRAVANGEYLIFAVNIGYLVDIALILRRWSIAIASS